MKKNQSHSFNGILILKHMWALNLGSQRLIYGVFDTIFIFKKKSLHDKI